MTNKTKRTDFETNQKLGSMKMFSSSGSTALDCNESAIGSQKLL